MTSSASSRPQQASAGHGLLPQPETAAQTQQVSLPLSVAPRSAAASPSLTLIDTGSAGLRKDHCDMMIALILSGTQSSWKRSKPSDGLHPPQLNVFVLSAALV